MKLRSISLNSAGMFAIGEMTGAIVNVHARIGSAVRDDIEQRIALVDARGGILVRLREQGRLAKPPVADNAKGFVFLPCQMGRNRLRTSGCECRRLLYIFRFAWLLTPFSR